MKKIILSGIAVISVFLFSKCTSNGDKTKTGDSTKIKTIPVNLSDTTTPTRLVFLNDSILGEIKEKQDQYMYLIKNFKPIPQDKFDEYHDFFKTVFKINTPAPIISFAPPSFLIYDKYNTIQSDLAVQADLVFKPATGTQPPITFKNKIRIYPAITPSNEFYLLMMAEQKDLTTTPELEPFTNVSTYYSIKAAGAIPVPSTTQAETDIRKFQTTWLNTVAPLFPKYTFDPLYSFSYTIEDYNELLGNKTGFWNWRQFQTVPSPREMVKVFPIVVTDDPLLPLHASFKLVFVPYHENLGGSYTVDNTRGFFDNMFPCPTQCPSNSIN